jgi:uncharacterized membrane protein
VTYASFPKIASLDDRASLRSASEFPILIHMSSQAGPILAHARQARAASIARLSSEVFDVAVIGGGIAGACAAWDAALRGLKVALIERSDFGAATSAHSLKVLHGGIRYLQHSTSPGCGNLVPSARRFCVWHPI